MSAQNALHAALAQHNSGPALIPQTLTALYISQRDSTNTLISAFIQTKSFLLLAFSTPNLVRPAIDAANAVLPVLENARDEIRAAFDALDPISNDGHRLIVNRLGERVQLIDTEIGSCWDLVRVLGDGDAAAYAHAPAPGVPPPPSPPPGHGPPPPLPRRRESIYRVRPSRAHVICQICQYAVPTDKQATLHPCNHTFHSHCIDNWLQNRARCPSCVRAPLRMVNADGATIQMPAFWPKDANGRVKDGVWDYQNPDGTFVGVPPCEGMWLCGGRWWYREG